MPSKATASAEAAKAVINSAIQGGSFEQNLKDGLKTALIDTAAATGASAIGDLTKDKKLDDFTNKVAHAIAGCAVGAVRSDSSGGCAAGALGAAIGELAAETYGKRDDTVQLAAIVAGLAVALTGGDATLINLASQASANAATNNYLAHVHKRMTWKAARAAGLGVVASDLISAAAVAIDVQGFELDDSADGFTIRAQDVEHSHMHGMCAAGSSSQACGRRVEQYRQSLWDLRSIAGLAGLLHLYQDEFAPGHANLHTYNGKVGLEHLRGDSVVPRALEEEIVKGSSAIIDEYLRRCQCLATK